VPGIVVGASGSRGSSAAVRWAADEAALRAERLLLVHAWSLPLSVTVDLPPGAHPDIGTAATSAAVMGDPADVLLGVDADLLVVGPGPVRDRLSPLARRLLHESRQPVVVVHGAPRGRTGRVVVGVCGTAASAQALRWAAEEARLRSADLVVVHAWQVHPTSLTEVFLPARAVAGQQGPVVDRLRTWVHATLGSRAPTDVRLRAEHGGSLDGLLDAATEADLLVLGRSEHGALHRLVLGAVGDDVGGLARCPVAVVPAAPSRLRSPV
jgi:nucleotide-binding universal stress UspA family protein